MSQLTLLPDNLDFPSSLQGSHTCGIIPENTLNLCYHRWPGLKWVQSSRVRTTWRSSSTHCSLSISFGFTSAMR
ncbi:6592_t:CDS:1, partial [Ambispora gerdemannii]